MSINIVSLTFLLNALLIGFIGLILLVKYWEWLPVILLPLIWYLPGLTTPGGLLERVRIVRWFIVLVIPFLVLIQAGKNIVSRKPLRVPVIKEPLLALIVLAVLSALINASGFLNLMAYFTTCLPYPLLFIILVNMSLSDTIVIWFTGIFLFLAFIQVPEIISRYLIFGIIGDRISLTLGIYGHYNIGIFSIYAVALIVAHALTTRIRVFHLIACMLLLICSLIGEIKAMVIMVPVIITAVVLAHLYKQSSQGSDIGGHVSKLLIGILVILLILPVYQNWGKVQKGNQDTLTVFYHHALQLTSGNQSLTRKDIYKVNRIGILVQVWDVVKHRLLNLMFGFGPGSSLGGQFFNSPGRFLSLLKLPKWMVLPQIPSTVGDIGIIGLLIHLWIFVRLFQSLLAAHLKAESVLHKTLFAALFGIWVFYAVLGPLYNIVWRSDIASYIFYFYMAVACTRASQNTPLP